MGSSLTTVKTDILCFFQSEETRSKIASLEQQVACLEDELSEARLVASKVKTELISEKSAWEVKLSEMQSKVNEVSFVGKLRNSSRKRPRRERVC